MPFKTPETPETPTVQLTRLNTNQLILGKTTATNTQITILEPYEGIPTEGGLQIIPFDQHICGVKLNLVTIQKNNCIYTNDVSKELANLYLTQISGIIAGPKKELIL